MLSTSVFLAAAMQCAASIHPDTALDVARVESGFHPYAVAEIVPVRERAPGSHGVISHRPATRNDALRLVRRLAAKQRRYSVGLMQITSTNFRQYGVSAADLLDPCTNLSVFERILTDCYRRGGTLKRALSCYYSGNFTTGQRPEPAFNHASYVQRIGYVVPSTRKDRQRPSALSTLPAIHYPPAVLRGEPATPPPAQSALHLHYPDTLIRGEVSATVTQEEQ
ncbi:lytic transglycosylase domain-containing protein [Sodalis sp. RH16]|uniref:lytic transglycosylase domain-containing protein n=1 Tax=Sodalis sp. RH16 TaxID=3394331 RepID=UPI0039B37949